jgi:hypothetical protein
MGPWVHVRIVEPTRPRPIAELRLIDGDIPDQLLGTVDEAGAIRIVPRPDGEPWDLSLRELSQALWEAEDRLRDVAGPLAPLDIAPLPRTRVRKPRKTTPSA